MQVKTEINKKATVDGACSLLLAHTRVLVRERYISMELKKLSETFACFKLACTYPKVLGLDCSTPS